MFWFQQGGTAVHTAHVSMQTPKRIFSSHINHGVMQWPASSSDLIALEFLFLGIYEMKSVRKIFSKILGAVATHSRNNIGEHSIASIALYSYKDGIEC